VVGDGPAAYLDSVRGRVSQLSLDKQVSFPGKVPHNEMRQVYEHADVLVFPSSRPEGLPLTMVEAMLGGCAVLSTGAGGAGEVAALGGHPLFPPEDSPALSRLLSQLIDDRDQVHELAARGQQVAVKEFSLDRMLERWLATLQRVVEQGAGR
jgi:glycosyltransferase involved in cell wall biosynthesis